MAEWLGTGLQNRLQQFDSAWYLSKTARFFYRSGLFFNISMGLYHTKSNAVR